MREKHNGQQLPRPAEFPVSSDNNAFPPSTTQFARREGCRRLRSGTVGLPALSGPRAVSRPWRLRWPQEAIQSLAKGPKIGCQARGDQACGSQLSRGNSKAIFSASPTCPVTQFFRTPEIVTDKEDCKRKRQESQELANTS